jgi:hypothetical protein
MNYLPNSRSDLPVTPNTTSAMVPDRESRQERVHLSERTLPGLQRAKAQ